MTGPDFEFFCKLVRDRSGLVLTPAKAYLVNSRLEPVAHSLGLAGVPEFLAHLRAGASTTTIGRAVDAMATHESSFFRDIAPFEQLATQVLPGVIAARQATKAIRIWCAASSSGQEPYSVAMVLQEMSARLSGWRLEITATDMSESILRKARSGIYSDFEVRRGLSPERLNRWFTRKGEAWEASATLRSMIQFKPHNLLQGTSGMGPFDVIFCRNVLIYFDLDGKRQVLGDLSKALAPDGVLFLGSAETVLGVTKDFEGTPGARGLYRRPSVAVAKTA